jgi:glycine dehydrogenase subunit 2
MRNQYHSQLLFEIARPGVRGVTYPQPDVPTKPVEDLIPAGLLAEEPLPLPEVGEPDVVRHYTNLSTQNMSVDTHFYPLGSCTMKYNPKRNERLSSLPGFLNVHPMQPDETVQGLLEAMHDMQHILGEVAGLPSVSLQPAAGAHGELTALLVARAYFQDIGQAQRTRVLIPDSAHGTNPASAALSGFQTVTLKSTATGAVDLDDLRKKLDDRTAVFMITNPNTLGMFEQKIKDIADLVHEAGGLIYLDGANMNAILGVARPGDFGADMMHYNLHKTFSGPHGGGGPGSGPIAVRDFLGPYLPGPVVAKEADGFHLVDPPKTIGRMRTFFGTIGILLRAYTYALTHGPDGLRRVSEHAVLNANYLLSQVQSFLPVPAGSRCLHEFVASAKNIKSKNGMTAMDIAKGLLDEGFHAPTVYFPLIVPEALMMEPTETESKETLDAFVAALKRIVAGDAEAAHQAPYQTPVSRPNEVAAARSPRVHWDAQETSTP